MTKIKNIFEKPIDRYIEGVIKADDESSLRQEVEEYVLTNEVAQRLENFLDAYNNYEGANGAWISGFFGSGKSHLLKILSMLLMDRSLDGDKALELFLPKCEDNEFLRSELRKAVAVPSHSILFNIDQKADVISKTELDALVAVFVKVFDELCGYYEMQPHIAQFERELDQDGLLQVYREAFETRVGKDWNFARTRINRFSADVDKIYNEVTGADAEDVIDKFRQDYRLSIDDFANNVKDYIDRQGPGFRLNFFVDEVGQYIAEHRKLMVNLQTVAESLAVKCQGQSWVIVTSQEDIDSVIGELTSQQSYDFSKIQARFANRLKLKSSDVSEVINKRLLDKTEAAATTLGELYDREKNNLKTLFEFAEGGRALSKLRNKEQFVASYPFLPYQYDLFQSAIQQLSRHNAFEGRHSSVGERSMLAVFKEVAMGLVDQPVGTLATFDRMFEGLKNSLKSDIQQSIVAAERQLDDPFALRLLKAMFLVKYVHEFHASPSNLCVLMRERFDQSSEKLLHHVTEALDLLEQQSYVQRNGDLYEFLTDEEQDIEQEIKDMDVPADEITKELAELIFDRTLREAKITYEKNGQPYRFTRKVDGVTQGREYDLAINVITPLNDEYSSLANVLMRSMGLGELMVVMPADDRLFRELSLYKKTDRYIRHNTSTSQSESTSRILAAKAGLNQQRRADLEERIAHLLGHADQYVDTTKLDLGGNDARSRIIQGFNELISRVFPNLSMLRDVRFTENDIAGYVAMDVGGLIGAGSLGEFEQEVLARIQSNQAEGLRSTVKLMVEHFGKRPYGWWDWATVCTIAMLYARGKIEVRRDVDTLEGDSLTNALRNTHQHPQLVLEPQVEFTPSQLRNLKQFAVNFFNKPFDANEARALGAEINEEMTALAADLEAKLGLSSNYPFLEQLKEPLKQIKGHAGKPYSYYFKKLREFENDLLDARESVIDPILSFINGDRKQIFDDCRSLLLEQKDNFGYLEGQATSDLERIISDSDCYKGQAMQQAKSLLDSIKKAINTRLAYEKAHAEEILASMRKKLEQQVTSIELSDEHKAELQDPFDSAQKRINETKHIALVREVRHGFEDQTYDRLVARIAEWSEGGSGGGEAPEAVNISQLDLQFPQSWLSDEAAVERYIEQLKQAMLEEIRAGRRLIL